MEFEPTLWQENEPEAGGGILEESQEAELSAALLAVVNEEQLDRIFRRLIRESETATFGTLIPSVAQAVAALLARLLHRVISTATRSHPGIVGASLGKHIGSSLEAFAGQILGLELEGLSSEDREFEAARQFVKFGAATVKNAIGGVPSNGSFDLAHRAAVEAAETLAPGLIVTSTAAQPQASYHSSLQNHFVRNAVQPSNSHTGEEGMHDLDRTQFRYGEEMESYPLTSETPVLSEAQEMEYAAELMELETEGEFENFLGDLIGGVGKVLNSATGNALGGLLKGAAKKLLPVAGTALGGFFGGPLGAALGGKLAGAVGGSLEMEAEADQREWEAAQTFVKLAVDAAKNAAMAPPGQDPRATAQQALVEAAQKHAPDLISTPGSKSFQTTHEGCHCGQHHPHHHHRSGQWERHGSRIVLSGL